MCEILAPAGDENSAFAAINAGADAIYLGLKQFSARSSAENFNDESLQKIIKFAHVFGVKVYVAMNTLIKDDELQDFISSAIDAWNCGCDAIIISDIFLGKFIKQNYPEIVLHLSTQAGACNKYAALLAKDYGFSRVILSRETSLNDIKQIADIIETEVFVQGALCTCFSGQCYFSSFAGGNSGNRGKCKQPCRKKYSIPETVASEPSYRLSLSDLSVGEDIEKLKEAGVFSFKIEGRMRRPEYVSAAVKYYKNILNGTNSGGDLSDLKRTYNRGNYTKGLAFGQDKSFLSTSVQGHIGEFAGVVKVENGNYLCQSNQKFCKGDGFKILRDGKEVAGASYFAEARGGFLLSSRERLKNGDKAFITTDVALNARLLELRRALNVEISAEFYAGKPAKVMINGHKFFGSTPLESASTKPVTAENIINCFKKVDKFPFAVSFGDILTDGVFIATSELNAFRRRIFEEFFEIITKNNNKQLIINHKLPKILCKPNNKTAAICNDLSGVVADVGILKLDDYLNVDIAKIKRLTSGFLGEKFLFMSPFLTGEEVEKIIPVLQNFDGAYCDGLYGIKLCQTLQIPLFAGTGLNIGNGVSLSECKAKYVALSKELTVKEASAIAAENAFYLAAGAVKVMDLIYCPFEKKCKSCSQLTGYTLTDENGRKFPLKRYKTSGCRFEVYNCANLIAENRVSGLLADCSLEKEPEKLVKICGDAEKLKEYFCGNYTRGHSVIPIK